MITKVTNYCIEAYPFGTLPMSGVVTLFRLSGLINVNCQQPKQGECKDVLDYLRKIEEAVIAVQQIQNNIHLIN